MKVFRANFLRELKFMFRDRVILIWIIVSLTLSTISILQGVFEIGQQNDVISKLVQADQSDRREESKKLSSWGSAAYYNFHFTYNLPSEFAFAALGHRDKQPWKHRIRMLALEGQIYERDTGNPVIALMGRFDFAFMVAFIFPIILIIVLHDMRSSERDAGRFEYLITMANSERSLWIHRAYTRSFSLYLSLVIPLIFSTSPSFI